MGFDYSTITDEKREEYGKLKQRRSLIESIERTLNSGKTPVIAETKKASPSRGDISGIDPEKSAREMESNGACAISVLTDKHFKGKIQDLRNVKRAVDLPVLRKDFITDPFQIYESYGNGADAILLIAALTREKTKKLLQITYSLGMEALVEIHDTRDLKYALDSGARLIGINNRDLKTLEINLGTTEELAPKIPKDRIIVCESGVRDKTDIERMTNAGACAFLIGTGIMSSQDIGAKMRELTAPIG